VRTELNKSTLPDACAHAPPLPDARAQVNIVSNGVPGVFDLPQQMVVCGCSNCSCLPAAKRLFTPTQFERHSGSGAKKWRTTFR
jgi:hypothetical protein